MGEFHDITHIEEISAMPDVDDYMDGEEDGNFSKLDIIHLFGKEKLENIQKSLSKATGLAFITVDFRGDPITEATFFSKFCVNVRNDTYACERCKSSDAFGSIQAAVTQKTNVYFCPCGLLEVAIPIVVRGHYLGGFIGGQIRCNDAPDSVSRLASVMHSVKSDEVKDKYHDLLDEIPVYSYEKFLDIANLVFLVINQLSENEISQQMKEEILKKRIKKMQTSNQHHLKENNLKNMQIQSLKLLSNPYGILDILTSLLNLTVIENAPQTNEMLTMFIDYLKYTYMEKETFTHVSGELEHAEQYLMFQKKRLGDRLEYSIQVPKDMHMQKIPSQVLLPFIQNAVYNGIMLKKEGGKINIGGYMRNNDMFLEVSDSGSGLSNDELDIKFESYKDRHEGYYIKLGMDYAKEKMKRLFGEEYSINVEESRNQGRKCILFWPEHFNDRVE